MTPAPFDLTLRHLRALSAVVTQGSLSAAAQAVGLSQPALTQGLRKLERQLEAQLFERRPDGVTCDAGRGRACANRRVVVVAHATRCYGHSTERDLRTRHRGSSTPCSEIDPVASPVATAERRSARRRLLRKPRRSRCGSEPMFSRCGAVQDERKADLTTLRFTGFGPQRTYE